MLDKSDTGKTTSIWIYNKTWFFSNMQVVSEVDILNHVSITICQYDVRIWSSHLNMIIMEIPINSDGSTGYPIWEVHPVWR